jgi:hypothetical protein
MRTFLGAISAVVFTLIGLELGARLLAAARLPGDFGAALDAHLAGLYRDEVPARAARFGGHLEEDEVIHPYLGFAIHPERDSQPGTFQDFGFPQWGTTAPPPLPLERERRADEVVVGVFGGSAAAYFVEAGGPERLIAQIPEYAGRTPFVVSTAQGGFKQPQQLLSLSYLLALGVHLDVVLLLDGFNEIALAPAENVKTGVHPFYPRRWDWRVARLGAIDRSSRETMGEIAYRGRRRTDIVLWLRGSPLRHSGVVQVAWWAWDRREEAAIGGLRVRLSESSKRPLDYAEAGPRWETVDEGALLDKLVRVWRNSSIAMNDLCRGRGIGFFHALQPNQYVPGSKPMSEAERRVAISPEAIYAPFVIPGYQRLLASGSELRAAGVDFFDLTRAFTEVVEPLYVDGCCHVSRRGSEILADQWAAAIRARSVERDDGRR